MLHPKHSDLQADKTTFQTAQRSDQGTTIDLDDILFTTKYCIE